MNEDQTDKAGQRRTRMFLVVFVGAALLLALSIILGTWSRIGEAVVATQPAAQ